MALIQPSSPGMFPRPRNSGRRSAFESAQDQFDYYHDEVLQAPQPETLPPANILSVAMLEVLSEETAVASLPQALPAAYRGAVPAASRQYEMNLGEQKPRPAARKTWHNPNAAND